MQGVMFFYFIANFRKVIPLDENLLGASLITSIA